MIRLALIGCGEHARVSHAAPLARYAAEHPGEISLAAACDVDLGRADEFRRVFGFERAVASLDELLDTGAVDACVAVVPIDRIADVGVRLLERGIPCVVEKPLGASIADAERLARAARKTGTPHMVSVNRRFLPYLNRAIAWASDIGPLRYVRATMVRHERDEPDFVCTTAIHAVDALRHVAGEVAEFGVEILRGDGTSTPWYVVSLAFTSGATGRVEVLPTSGIVEESYELFGEGFRSRVVVDGAGPQRSLELWRGGMLVDRESRNGDEPEFMLNGGYAETVRFVEAVRGNYRPSPEIEDVLPSARICFAIRERATSGGDDTPAATSHQVPAPGAGKIVATTLSSSQELILRAAVDRVIPPDDAPGASEAGVLDYIARKLGGDLAPADFAAGLDALDAEAAARFGRGFVALRAAEQDDILRLIEAGRALAVWPVEPAKFFALLVDSTAEGYYGDPGNGGNRGEVSWKMCGFKERLRV